MARLQFCIKPTNIGKVIILYQTNKYRDGKVIIVSYHNDKHKPTIPLQYIDLVEETEIIINIHKSHQNIS